MSTNDPIQANSPIESKAAGRARWRPVAEVLLWAVFGALLWFGVFRWPFWFPPAQVSSSPAYEAGFNNRVAILAALAGAALVMLYGFWRLPGFAPELPRGVRSFPISPKLVWGAIAVYVVIAWTLEIGALATPEYMGDTRYFLSGFTQITVFHRMPYRDFDYVYGPLLLYAPVWLHQLPGFSRLSLEACCYLMTGAMNVWSLWLLAYSISKTIASRFNGWLFVLLTLMLLPATGAPNGSLIRYITPYAALIFLAGIPGPAGAQRALREAAFVFAATCFIVSISPEMGIAFGIGASVFSLYRAIFSTRGAGWLGSLVPLGAVPLALASCVLWIGPDWFRSLAAFSKGGMSFVALPNPFVLGYLVLVLISSVGVGALLRRPGPETALWLALYSAALCTLPPLLARIMFGHVFLYGLDLFLFAFAVIATGSVARQRWATVAFGVLFLFGHFRAIEVDPFPLEAWTLNALGQTQTGRSIQAGMLRVARRWKVATGLDRFTESASLPVRELPAIVGQEAVATPWGTDKVTDETLLRAGVYHPEYYTDFINVSLPEAEPRKIRALQECRWALVPKKPQIGTLDLPLIRRLLFYPANYRTVRQPYVPGKELYAYLQSHYHVVRELGAYQLFERNE